jgi:hypothetical protein
MRKLLSAAVLATALLASTAANAAAMLFKFDTANSKIEVVDQGGGFCFGCSLSSNTTLQEGPFSINEGASATYDFANLSFNGLGLATGVKLKATLAFLTPDVADATTNGNATYGTLFGWLNAGKLTWDTIAPITTTDGSQFTVSFGNLEGLGFGTVQQNMTIAVNSVAAVPEPGTWALMIGGFGLAGAMLRRRRQSVLALAA